MNITYPLFGKIKHYHPLGCKITDFIWDCQDFSAYNWQKDLGLTPITIIEEIMRLLVF